MNLVFSLAGISTVLLLTVSSAALGQSLPDPVIEGRIANAASPSISVAVRQAPHVELHASRFVIVPSDAILAHMPVITPPEGLVLAMPVIRPRESSATARPVPRPLPKAQRPER